MSDSAHKMPDVLYKYRDYKNSWNKETLFNFELFLSSTSDFNDPYEGSIPFEYDPNDLTKENIFLKLRDLAIKKHPKWTDDQIHKFCFDAQQRDLLNDKVHVEEFNRNHRASIEAIYGILSLTCDPKNYLMWSHYSGGHSGFCVGFDTKILIETVKGNLGPVQYETELPKLKLFGNHLEFYVKQLNTKSKVWCYENEYRIVKSNAARQTIKYPKEMIREIYFGVKMDLKDKNVILDFVRLNQIECKIYDLILDRDEFKLNATIIYDEKLFMK